MRTRRLTEGARGLLTTGLRVGWYMVRVEGAESGGVGFYWDKHNVTAQRRGIISRAQRRHPFPPVIFVPQGPSVDTYTQRMV